RSDLRATTVLCSTAIQPRAGCLTDLISLTILQNSFTSSTSLTFAWLIRASWLIWGSIVHRINRITRIHHDLLGDRSHTRLSGTTQNDSIIGRAGPPGAPGHRARRATGRAGPPGAPGHRARRATGRAGPPGASGHRAR